MIAAEYLVVSYCQGKFGTLCGFTPSETSSTHRKEMIRREQFSPLAMSCYPARVENLQ